MLIIYPTPNWNTFAPLTTLITAMEYQFPTHATAFKLLPIDQQNSIAMNAGTWIRTCKGLQYPSPLPQDFVLAQVAIMASTYLQDPLTFDPNSRAITNETVGELSVSYDPKYKGDSLDINPLIYRYLTPYGCSKAGGFKMAPLGRA